MQFAPYSTLHRLPSVHSSGVCALWLLLEGKKKKYLFLVDLQHRSHALRVAASDRSLVLQ